MEVQLKSDNVGGFSIFIDGTNFGTFDQINGVSKAFCYFPKLTDRMTGDHLIIVGRELNNINQKFRNERE